MRLAVVASHPIQYQAPIFRELSRRTDLEVFFAHRATPTDQAGAGFGTAFDWDLDLLSGYRNTFLRNVAKQPRLDRFAGCDTPEITDRLGEGGFDAVLVMGWHLKCFIQALVAAKRCKMPVLVRGDSHLETPRSPLKRAAKAFVYPAFLRVFDGALYVGERSRRYWTRYRYPSSRLFFSPHCIDAKFFGDRATAQARADLRARLNIRPSSNVALFAGKLIPCKRPLDLIAAIAQLKDRGRDVEVLVAGSGSLQTEMLVAAKKASVHCHMLGFCNQSQMPSVYAASDVLVLPSERETWGLVANEALACGRPIVVSDAVGAAPDLAADGSVGRAYAAGSVVALSLALEDVLMHPPSRDALAVKSARYSIAAAVEGIVRAMASASPCKPENAFSG